MIICIRLLILRISVKSSLLLWRIMMLARGRLVAAGETTPVCPDAKPPLETLADERALAYYDPVRKIWMAPPGRFQIQLSGSSRDLRWRGHFTQAMN